MRDTLYLVIDEVPYETTITVGLFTTRPAAELAAGLYEAKESPWNMYIEEWAGSERRKRWWREEEAGEWLEESLL